MNLFLLAEAFNTAGKIIIAYTAISVHRRVMKEHKIDDHVFKYMRKEQTIAGFGILMVIIGFSIHFIDQTF